jgi:hypothetical protein
MTGPLFQFPGLSISTAEPRSQAITLVQLQGPFTRYNFSLRLSHTIDLGHVLAVIYTRTINSRKQVVLSCKVNLHGAIRVIRVESSCCLRQL